jgi:uncharacterized protein YigE (DUF2233 family)
MARDTCSAIQRQHKVMEGQAGTAQDYAVQEGPMLMVRETAQ